MLSEGTHTLICMSIRGSTHLPASTLTGTHSDFLRCPGGQYWCHSEVVFRTPGLRMIPAAIPLWQAPLVNLLSSSSFSLAYNTIFKA